MILINKKQQRRMQAVCAGQSDWTVEEINQFTNYGRNSTCVVSNALADWTGKKMPPLIDVWTKGSKMKWPKLA